VALKGACHSNQAGRRVSHYRSRNSYSVAELFGRSCEVCLLNGTSHSNYVLKFLCLMVFNSTFHCGFWRCIQALSIKYLHIRLFTIDDAFVIIHHKRLRRWYRVNRSYLTCNHPLPDFDVAQICSHLNFIEVKRKLFFFEFFELGSLDCFNNSKSCDNR
jgi:hypothetical protein